MTQTNSITEMKKGTWPYTRTENEMDTGKRQDTFTI